eukprot:3150319-Amphidinium_carterae.1
MICKDPRLCEIVDAITWIVRYWKGSRSERLASKLVACSTRAGFANYLKVILPYCAAQSVRPPET